MQHRESYVEMNIDAIVDANATIGIDDVNRVSGVDEYHQLYRTVVFVEVSTIMKTFLKFNGAVVRKRKECHGVATCHIFYFR